MTDSLKEAVERAHDTLEIVGHFLSGMTEVDPRADVLMLLNSVRASTRALSALKAAERPQPVPGDGEGVKAELAREEAAHVNTIDQRDAAEEALSRAYFLVAGRHPPWSNVFLYSDALAEIEETVAALSRVSTPGRSIQSSVGSPPEGGTPSPSDGQVLRAGGAE